MGEKKFDELDTFCFMLQETEKLLNINKTFMMYVGFCTSVGINVIQKCCFLSESFWFLLAMMAGWPLIIKIDNNQLFNVNISHWKKS